MRPRALLTFPLVTLASLLLGVEERPLEDALLAGGFGGFVEGLLEGVPDLAGDFFATAAGEAGKTVEEAAALAEGVRLRPLPMRSKVEGTRWLRRGFWEGGARAFPVGVLLRPREGLDFFAAFLGVFEAFLTAGTGTGSTSLAA